MNEGIGGRLGRFTRLPLREPAFFSLHYKFGNPPSHKRLGHRTVAGNGGVNLYREQQLAVAEDDAGSERAGVLAAGCEVPLSDTVPGAEVRQGPDPGRPLDIAW